MRTLRKLIREYLDEMAYGGMVGDAVSGSGGEVKKKIQKFHQSPLYLKKATSTFKNFPFDVWIQVVDTSELDEEGFESLFDVGIEDSRRLNIMGIEDLMREKGDLPFDVDKIGSIVKGGGCVILSLVSDLRSGFLPTPWMLVHALIDSEDTASDEHSEFSAIAREIEDYVEEVGFKNAAKIFPYMTMASARNKELAGPNDVIAELCVQEIVTEKGVNFLESGKPGIDKKLNMIKEKVKSYNLKKVMSDALRGKIVAIAAS